MRLYLFIYQHIIESDFRRLIDRVGYRELHKLKPRLGKHSCGQVFCVFYIGDGRDGRKIKRKHNGMRRKPYGWLSLQPNRQNTKSWLSWPRIAALRVPPRRHMCGTAQRGLLERYLRGPPGMTPRGPPGTPPQAEPSIVVVNIREIAKKCIVESCTKDAAAFQFSA